MQCGIRRLLEPISKSPEEDNEAGELEVSSRSGLICRAISSIGKSVRCRRFSSRIAARMASSAEALTAGLKPQNSVLSLERRTSRGRKPYPRKSNC
jgi:hypothetical protein